VVLGVIVWVWRRRTDSSESKGLVPHASRRRVCRRDRACCLTCASCCLRCLAALRRRRPAMRCVHCPVDERVTVVPSVLPHG
jgi:hypothetical protein